MHSLYVLWMGWDICIRVVSGTNPAIFIGYMWFWYVWSLAYWDLSIKPACNRLAMCPTETESEPERSTATARLAIRDWDWDWDWDTCKTAGVRLRLRLAMRLNTWMQQEYGNDWATRHVTQQAVHEKWVHSNTGCWAVCMACWEGTYLGVRRVNRAKLRQLKGYCNACRFLCIWMGNRHEIAKRVAVNCKDGENAWLRALWRAY